MKITKYIVISFGIIFLTTLILYYENVVSLSYLITILVISLFLHIIIYYQYYYYHHKIVKVNETIEAILNGHLETRMISNRYEDNRELTANLNRLAKKMEKLTVKKEEDELTIQILSNNMMSAIIYIDIDGKIRYVNNQFNNHFLIELAVIDIYEKISNKKIYSFIDDAFVFERNKVITLQVYEKYYQAHAMPISSSQHQFAGILFIFQDITELKKYERLQREFLADASHELKTPISAIRCASEILLNGERHSLKTIVDFIRIINDENKRMEKIVEDILLISKIESDNIAVNLEKLSLNDLLKEVLEIIQINIKKKNQRILEEVEEHLYIIGDRERLKHAILNLVLNASIYTNESKSIYIVAYSINNQVKLKIKDEGIGIEEDEIDRIFERFYRIDKARSRETGGTGLGLSIVKSTLDMHQASIEVKSEVNKGSEFIVTFAKHKER